MHDNDDLQLFLKYFDTTDSKPDICSLRALEVHIDE